MRVKQYTNPGHYLERIRPLLEQNEAVNNMILGISARICERPDWIDTAPYQTTVEDEDGQLVLAALMTPPQHLQLAARDGLPQSAVNGLIQHLLAGGWEVPGINAEKALAERFVQKWTATTGQVGRVAMRKGVYELRQVNPMPHPPAGGLRLADEADKDLIIEWRRAFIRESLREEPPDNIGEIANHYIQAGSVYLWDDHGPVSSASTTRATTHGVTINGVYTPPENRGHGYASACVAGLSQKMLDAGKLFCALFTDLDYPTSNSIYQKIGYRRLGDFTDYAFTALNR